MTFHGIVPPHPITQPPNIQPTGSTAARSSTPASPAWLGASLLVLMLLIGLTGCSTPTPPSNTAENSNRVPEPISPVESQGAPPRSRSTGGIDSLHLFTVPIALSFDSDPRPDGFDVRVYASSQSNAKGIAITRGTLEILMYDGSPRRNEGNQAKPVHVWRFTNAQLKANQARSSLGFGYRFRLRWGDTPPTASSITVVARYQAAEGGIVLSAPSTIAVSAQ